MLEILLIGSLLLVFHAYFGYPLSLFLISLGRRKKARKAPFSPYTTFLITAFNEGERIREKLDNTLALNYPAGKLQVLVASDGSTDRTNDIVREYEQRGVHLVNVKNRGGKENAQKVALTYAKGDIIVFSDVATQLKETALQEIVNNFADASVGCVSSEDRVVGKEGRPTGEGIYVKYEMLLRRLESGVHSLVGLSGSFFAARKEVCRDFSGEMQSDFRTVLNSVKLGLRAICDPEAIGYYQDVGDEKREFERKVRTVVRGLTVFFRNLEFLNVAKYGLFSYQLLCHKLLRWLAPLFLVVAFCTNAFLAPHSWLYGILLFLHIGFYVAACWGWRAGTSFSNILVKIPTYFLTVNAAIFLAWLKYLGGQRLVMWSPSKR